MRTFFRFILFGCFFMANVAYADVPWPCKTGPYRCGVARDVDADGLPTKWNEADQKNVVWKVGLEGAGHSTPVIGDNQVWFTSATEDGTEQFVYCIDAQDGKILHHRLLFENADPEPLNNPVNSYASPSCFLTDNAIYIHFGTYGTAKLDSRTAEVKWVRRDIHCRHFRGPGSSPVLHEGLLVLTFDGIDQQFLTALNARTGKTIWRTDRTTDYGDLDEDGKPRRDGDLRKAYGTPAVVKVGDRNQVVSVGSRAAFGYDLQTGKELWTVRHDDYNAAAQPLIFDDMAVMNTGSRGANLFALQLKDSTLGDVTDSLKWNREKGNSRLCFPVLHEGLIYSLTDNGVLYCVSAETGEQVWSGRIGGNFVATPFIANDLIYMFDEKGRGTVAKTGQKFEVVAKNLLEEGGKASPAVASGAIFLRTSKHLYKLAVSP